MGGTHRAAVSAGAVGGGGRWGDAVEAAEDETGKNAARWLVAGGPNK